MGTAPPTHTQSTTPPHITHPTTGIRQDHRTASRPGGGKGWRFFVEDEDEFGLEGLLQVCGFRVFGAHGLEGMGACCDNEIRNPHVPQMLLRLCSQGFHVSMYRAALLLKSRP